MIYFILPYLRYFDFKGRSRRMEYWCFTIFQCIVVVFFAFSMASSYHECKTLYDVIQQSGDINHLIGLFLFLTISVIPWMSVTVRRLHDVNLSGWWLAVYFAANFIPVIGSFAGIAMLIVSLLGGTRGDNRFGADPKAEGGWALSAG